MYRLLEMVSEGSRGHGPIHLLSAGAAEIGFRWDPPALTWLTKQKNPAHLAGFVIPCQPRVWKRLRHVGLSFASIPDHKRRRNEQDD